MQSYYIEAKKQINSGIRQCLHGVFNGKGGSILKGRSMEFDELRDYNYGDDFRDIDWKASARSRNIMVRSYIPIRKHNILVVADSGRTMAALAPSGEQKSDIAAFCGGVLANIAMHRNDLIGLVYGDKERTKRYPMREDVPYIEHFLDNYYKNTTTDGPVSDVLSVLNYVSRSFSEKMFLVIITDAVNALALDHEILRKLSVRNQIMVIVIKDAKISDHNLRFRNAKDIESGISLPRYMRTNRAFAKAEGSYREAQHQCISAMLNHYRIVSCFVGDSKEAAVEIMRMLEEQKNA